MIPGIGKSEHGLTELTAEEGYNLLQKETHIRQKMDAQEYNRRLRLYGSTDHYEEMLNPGKNGLMGYLEIPSAKVYLQVYHGTIDGVLQSAMLLFCLLGINIKDKKKMRDMDLIPCPALMNA